MTSLENRVRAATRALAETIPPSSAPPLRLPDPAASRSRPGHPRTWVPGHPLTWSRWLLPTAAAAAVVVIGVGVVAAGSLLHPGRPVTGSGTSAGPTEGPVAGPPAGWYVSTGQVPPYYAQVQPNGNSANAVIRATATGKLIATIKPSAGDTIVAATAAANDRTFVLDEYQQAGPSSVIPSLRPRSFILLRLDSAGRPVSQTKLPMTAGSLVTGFALSPDGGRLAVAVAPKDASAPDLEQVRIYTLATGAVRTWSAQGLIGDLPDEPGFLSWVVDGKSLAFDWRSATSSAALGTWLLNTTLGGGSLLADSRQVQASYVPPAPAPSGPVPSPTATRIAPTPPTCQEYTMVTLDGTAVVCEAVGDYDQTSARLGADTEFLEYSTTTRKLIRVLGYWRFKYASWQGGNLLWSNPSGTVLIGAIPGSPTGQVGIIRGNQFTPLNVPDDRGPDFAGTW
jgi:hypothetical protein